MSKLSYNNDNNNNNDQDDLHHHHYQDKVRRSLDDLNTVKIATYQMKQKKERQQQQQKQLSANDNLFSFSMPSGPQR